MAPMRLISLKKLAATSLGVAAFALCLEAPAALADTPVASSARTLASELRIARGDLDRMGIRGLPEANRAGLESRLTGALGLLPWLLKQAGDVAGATRLEGLGTRLDDPDALAQALDDIAARHPLDLVDIGTSGVRARALLEARAIHETYCSGCHDGSGSGDPEAYLPIRDLFDMAREDTMDVFVARLYNGVKGDETIGFVNPLTETQFLALWRYYSTD